MTKTQLLTTVRKDASYVVNAMIAVVFVGFAGLAVASTVVDLMAVDLTTIP